jgi:hypothetical protein
MSALTRSITPASWSSFSSAVFAQGNDGDHQIIVSDASRVRLGLITGGVWVKCRSGRISCSATANPTPGRRHLIGQRCRSAIERLPLINNAGVLAFGRRQCASAGQAPVHQLENVVRSA